MRQRLTIILTILVIVGVLVIINVVTHVKVETPHDSELTPKRSTYHSGPTGIRALYDFLSESGYRVMRWREVPAKLLDNAQRVQTFVIIGPTPVQVSLEESEVLRRWVTRGGRLVIIDRSPPALLLPQSGDWKVAALSGIPPTMTIDPENSKQMTENVVALHPVQPTTLTAGVQSVLPSRFSSHIRFYAGAEKAGNTSEISPAPVTHFGSEEGALLVDYRFGNGRIILLSDPYVVANGGIRLNDNLQATLNIVAGDGGLIAFDEYHQGRGLTSNPFASYFAGTPIIAIGAQLIVLVVLVLWTRGRRFGRALPLRQVDRRSSLEFVASMSELQERSRAFDLAIENIYSRTRRALARHAGVEYNSSRALIASRVAMRSTVDAKELEILMRQCEEVINGTPIHWRQSLELVRRLREVERSLGLRMRVREIRQAAEHI
jgi:hypothetical protein